MMPAGSAKMKTPKIEEMLVRMWPKSELGQMSPKPTVVKVMVDQ